MSESLFSRVVCVALLSLWLVSGCASKQTSNSSDAVKVAEASIDATPSDTAFEDYGDEDALEISDPLEGWNRFWFGFNDVLLLKIMKPVHAGYSAVVPSPVRTGFSNAFHNAQMPVRLANCLLQGRFGEAWIEFGRFIVNTTVGFGGLFDVAKQSKPRIPVDNRDADFGQTLAAWGMGEGIYLVWPFVGPSTVRDTVGSAGDLAASPFFWLAEPVGFVNDELALATNLGFRFNDLGSVISAYEGLTRSAVEPYIAARDAYIKYRRMGVLQQRMQW